MAGLQKVGILNNRDRALAVLKQLESLKLKAARASEPVSSVTEATAAIPPPPSTSDGAVRQARYSSDLRRIKPRESAGSGQFAISDSMMDEPRLIAEAMSAGDVAEQVSQLFDIAMPQWTFGFAGGEHRLDLDALSSLIIDFATVGKGSGTAEVIGRAGEFVALHGAAISPIAFFRALGRAMVSAVAAGDAPVLRYLNVLSLLAAGRDPARLFAQFSELPANLDPRARKYLTAFANLTLEAGGQSPVDRSTWELLIAERGFCSLFDFVDLVPDSVWSPGTLTTSLEYVSLLKRSAGPVSDRQLVLLRSLAHDAIVKCDCASQEFESGAIAAIDLGDGELLGQAIVAMSLSAPVNSVIEHLVKNAPVRPHLWRGVHGYGEQLLRIARAAPGQAPAICEVLSVLGARSELLMVTEGLAAEIGSLRLVNTSARFHELGQGSEGEARNVGRELLLTDLNIPMDAYGQFRSDAELTVYRPSGITPNGEAAPEGVSFLDGTRFNDEQDYLRRLSLSAERVARKFADDFLAQVSDPKLLSIFDDLDDALFISIRTRLIGIIRRNELRRYWMRGGTEGFDRISIVASRPEVAEELCSLVREAGLEDRARLSLLPAKVKFAKMFPKLLEAEPASASAVAPPPSGEIEQQVLDLYGRFEPRFVPPAAESGTLFVSRLASRTVPGTILPIMRRFLQHEPCFLLEIRTAKDEDPKIDLSVFRSADGTPMQYALTNDMRTEARAAPAGAADTVWAWFRSNRERFGAVVREQLGEAYVADVLNDGVGMDLPSLAVLLSLHKSLAELLDTLTDFRVVVCPGRSVEAYAAQRMAARRGKISLDVMNAWMSDKSSYATPRGDYFAVIDEWSAELMIDHFNMQPESVVKTGTARYDGIYELTQTVDAGVLRDSFGLRRDQHIVCFATQPVNIDLNIAILDAIVRANDRGEAFTTIVKLHPREDQARRRAYEQYIETLPTELAERVRLFQRENIIQTVHSSDLVITLFSNVAVEAALCERDTIVCTFDEVPSPVPLEDMGLGIAVSTLAALTHAVADHVNRPDARQPYRLKRAKFLGENRHLLSGSTAQRVFELAFDLSQLGQGQRRRIADGVDPTPPSLIASPEPARELFDA